MAVVGGLIVSQLLTLYITPVFYVYMERFRVLLTKTGRHRKTTVELTQEDWLRELGKADFVDKPKI